MAILCNSYNHLKADHILKEQIQTLIFQTNLKFLLILLACIHFHFVTVNYKLQSVHEYISGIQNSNTQFFQQCILLSSNVF